MYKIIRFPQYDIDCTSDNEELDCEPEIMENDCICQACSSSSSLSDVTESNVKSVGSLQSNELSSSSTSLPSSITTTATTMKSFDSLPTETLLHLLLYVENPYDIVALSSVNRFLYSFIQQNSTSLARQLVGAIELRGSYDVKKRKHSIFMNISGIYYSARRSWKGLSFEARTISELNIEMFGPKLFFFDGSVVIRLDKISLTKSCFPKFSNCIEMMTILSYPDCRKRVQFEVQLSDCSFASASKKDISTFINKMIDLGCNSLLLNNVAYEDFTKLCTALSQSNLHLLKVFRFHSNDITTARAEPLEKIFKPFCRVNRKTIKLVIDGIQCPLELCKAVMVSFCCTPFCKSPPPYLRIVMSIHRNYSRLELFDMLKGVRSGVEDSRKALKQRLNHVYLELGMYENDVYLTQNQHCIVDVKVMKPKHRNVNAPPANVVVF